MRSCRTGEPDPFLVVVRCQAGYDGGLVATFTLELYTDQQQSAASLQSTVTNSQPTFSVYNLPPGTRSVHSVFIILSSFLQRKRKMH